MPDSLRLFKAGIFQAMGHATRIALLENLRAGEMSVAQLCQKVGVEQANASQHLAVLRNKQIVETRKEGNQIFYRLRDPVFGELLEHLRKYFLAHAAEAMELLRQERKAARVEGER